MFKIKMMGLILALGFGQNPSFAKMKASKVLFLQQLNQSLSQDIHDPALWSELPSQLKINLEMDEYNAKYFQLLLNKKFKASSSQPYYFIGTPSHYLNNQSITRVYPTAIATIDQMKEIPFIHFDKIKDNQHLLDLAKNATLLLRPMQAGTGTSLSRKKYLKEFYPNHRTNAGAKGTDLFIEIPSKLDHHKKSSVSLAELQILQPVLMANRNQFKKIIFQDLVSHDTIDSIKEIWSKPSFLNPKQSWEELYKKSKKIEHLPIPIVQAKYPTLNLNTNELSFNRVAPGGHGLFGAWHLLELFDKIEYPFSEHKISPIITAIGNGEDLSSHPGPEMIGHMIDKNIPIAMVTTEKTQLDLKGGQISLAYPENGPNYVTILEKAQAETTNQLKLFEQLGLRAGDQMAFFNTNMALFNDSIIIEKLKLLKIDLSSKYPGTNPLYRFMEIISPDLINNTKKQIENGKEVSYTQLEGALGSVILNLDRYWRKHYNEPFVHFINVCGQDRFKYFLPIKTAMDFFLQFHSDIFILSPISNRPIPVGNITLPQVTLTDSYYSELFNVLDSFEGVSVMGLNSLNIQGAVTLKGFKLRGDVTIINKSGKIIDLNTRIANKTLKNQKIVINE